MKNPNGNNKIKATIQDIFFHFYPYKLRGGGGGDFPVKKLMLSRI